MRSLPLRRASFANSLVIHISLLLLLTLAAFALGFIQMIGLPGVTRLGQTQLNLAVEQAASRYSRLLDSVEITLRSSQSWSQSAGLNPGELQRFNEFFFPILANNHEINSVIFADDSGH